MGNFLILIMTFLFGASALGQDITPVVIPPATDPTMDFMKLLIESMGGIQGANNLVIAAIVIKLLLNLLNLPFVENLIGSNFKDWSGGLKLTVVLGLSYIAGLLALMLPPTNLPLGAALVHSSALSMFVIFLNQLYQHFFQKKPKV